MKVGLVTHEYPPDVVGGVSLHTFLLAQGLAQGGHTVHVITLGREAEVTQEDHGVTVHRVLSRNLYPDKGRLRESLRRFEYSLGVMGKVRELLGRGALDIIQAHPLGADLFLYSLQVQDRVPMVTHLSTIYRELAACEQWRMSADLHISAWMEEEVIMRSQQLIAPSRVCAEGVAAYLGIDPGTIAIIPHGISIPDEASARQRTTGPTPTLRVLFVGRLERRKGVQTLIQAIPRVLDRMPGVSFSIIGADSYAGAAELARDGDARTSFKQRLLLELPHRYWSNVHFLGLCEEPVRERALSWCDLFVAPSLYESFGFIYLEAMAHAKPVIGCRVGGVPEVVDDGVTGLLVPPEDPEALAAAILRLLADPDLRQRMGAEGRRTVQSRFSVSQMIDRNLALYEQVLERCGAPWQSP